MERTIALIVMNFRSINEALMSLKDVQGSSRPLISTFSVTVIQIINELSA